MFTNSFDKAMENPEVKKAFERVRTREDQAWSAVNRLLGVLPRAEELKRGDVVFYNGETGWKYGEDARHTKGSWPDADWSKDGISNGEQGVVLRVKGKEAWVRWDKHYYAPHSKDWEGSYRLSELRKDPRNYKPDDFMSKHIKDVLNASKEIEDMEKISISNEWRNKHVLSGLSKRFSKYRGLSHPKATAKAYTENVAHAANAREEIHHLRELYPKRKTAKDVY